MWAYRGHVNFVSYAIHDVKRQFVIGMVAMARYHYYTIPRTPVPYFTIKLIILGSQRMGSDTDGDQIYRSKSADSI